MDDDLNTLLTPVVSSHDISTITHSKVSRYTKIMEVNISFVESVIFPYFFLLVLEKIYQSHL